MDVRREYGKRRIRLTSSVDAESLRFERELLPILAAKASGDGVGELPWIQTHAYLQLRPREFRLLQTWDENGAPAAQIAVFLSRPRRAPWFATAVAERFGPAAEGEEEDFALRVLRELFVDLGEAMSLRLRPERFDLNQLRDFQERASRAGYRLADAEDVTRTLLYDLRPTEEELLAAFSRKTRVKFRSPEIELVEIRSLTDRALIPQCREALNASFGRTVGKSAHFDFETTFSLIEKSPDRATVIGLFSKGRPERLLAYVTGFRSGAAAEYSSAGSLNDPELRGYPFNYWLLWNLILWAKASGASFIDLRGVTGGGKSDPLAGISEFKRRFVSRETEVGREMTAVLKPKLHSFFRSVNKLRGA
jgi:hypothetical protein